jgi:hypothetical protein
MFYTHATIGQSAEWQSFRRLTPRGPCRIHVFIQCGYCSAGASPPDFFFSFFSLPSGFPSPVPAAPAPGEAGAAEAFSFASPALPLPPRGAAPPESSPGAGRALPPRSPAVLRSGAAGLLPFSFDVPASPGADFLCRSEGAVTSAPAGVSPSAPRPFRVLGAPCSVVIVPLRLSRSEE